MSSRDVAAALARSKAGQERARRPSVAAAKDLTGGFLKGLKARGAEAGVWAVRGRVLSRVMVMARDARLSGGEWSVLSTIALHLHHLGRSRGMMTVQTLADDCMVTPRTVKNALRTLKAARFVHSTIRGDGSMTLTLDARFGPRAPVTAKAVDNSPRRAAARKKISNRAPLLPPSPRTITATPLPPTTPKRRNIPAAVAAGAAPRAESNGISQTILTATANDTKSIGRQWYELNAAMFGWPKLRDGVEYSWPEHGAPRIRGPAPPSNPPRKRARPAAP